MENEYTKAPDDLGALVEELERQRYASYGLEYDGTSATSTRFTINLVGSWHDILAGIRALQERVEELQRDNRALAVEAHSRFEDIDELEQRITVLETVARFYAPPEKYKGNYDPENVGFWCEILDDEGATARAVLPEYQSKKEGREWVRTPPIEPVIEVGEDGEVKSITLTNPGPWVYKDTLDKKGDDTTS